MKSNFENPVLVWGYDLNHERAATRELVDSVNAFWMKEYKVDGFRFDFTKGFSNTPYPAGSWGSEYDAARISNLKRMTDEIRKRNPKALIIFEHLAGNDEETELANYGILLWGNMSGNYTEAARGNVGASDLSSAIYSKRGWNEPNLIAFPESHDEQRVMYTIKQTGLSSGSYNIRNQTTALKRIELNSLFHFLIPGPKMIWQFGERGYDQSINRCEDGTISPDCRLAPKPPYWQYLDNPDRLALFKVIAKLNELKQTYPEFSSHNFTSDLVGAIKWYKYVSGENHALAVGNFDIEQKTASVTFPKTGKWYGFFSRDSVQISNTSQSIQLGPGEYRLYSTRKLSEPHVITENIPELKQSEIRIYPNPARNEINISAAEIISEILVYSATGKQVLHQKAGMVNELKINTNSFVPGIYLLKVVQPTKITTLKFIKE